MKRAARFMAASVSARTALTPVSVAGETLAQALVKAALETPASIARRESLEAAAIANSLIFGLYSHRIGARPNSSCK
jgi:ribosomal protein S7